MRIEAAPIVVAERRHAVHRHPAQAVAADGHIIAAQPVRLGKFGDIPQQGTKGLQAVIIGITGRAKTGQQVINQISNAIGNQGFAWAAGATKSNTNGGEITFAVIFTQYFSLCGGITQRFTVIGTTRVGFTAITQLVGPYQ
ncbi:hypothetical protein D3C80_1799220 [compost metagenome]